MAHMQLLYPTGDIPGTFVSSSSSRFCLCVSGVPHHAFHRHARQSSSTKTHFNLSGNTLSYSSWPLYKHSDHPIEINGLGFSKRNRPRASDVTLAVPVEQEDVVNIICKTIQRNDQWEELLDLVAQDLVPNLVVKVLNLQTRPQTALRFFIWADRQKGYEHNTDAYYTVLGILGRAKMFDEMVSILKQMRSQGCEVTKSMLNSIINAYGLNGRVKEAQEVFNLMEDLGHKPSLIAYNSLLVALVKNKNLVTMGNKKKIALKRKANKPDITPLHSKKQKISDSLLPENPSRLSPHNSVPVNLTANNENQKPETTLPLESVKKKRKPKQKKKKTSGVDQKPETASPIESVTKKKKNRGSKNKTSREIFKEQLKGNFYFKDKHLDKLLEKLSRSVEATRHPKGKIYDNRWTKQWFSVGINDVTRTLERMPVALDKPIQSYISDFNCSPDAFPNIEGGYEENGPNKQFVGMEIETRGQGMHLQAVLTAIDCHPRVLVSHLPGLASSRGVPLFSVEDHGTGSERLGQLLKLKTAVAIGVKVGESTINKVIQDAIDDQVLRLKCDIDVESQEMASE